MGIVVRQSLRPARGPDLETVAPRMASAAQRMYTVVPTARMDLDLVPQPTRR
jgi:hypothetical protein